ncbi:MAG: hypothetical protein ACR2GH_08430 [Pseudonocardia sp.]
MSEYQYYEFVAIDRPLDGRQLDQVRALSTRAHITPSSFVNTYQWGNFRGDPRALMARYYDAFIYLANWGTRQVMLRVPARLLDLATAQRYCVGDVASAWRSGEHVIIDLVSEDESGGDFEWGGEGWLASIIPSRAELVARDLRLLYVAWLLCVQADEVPDEATEPPVPSGLATLTGSLESLVEFLRIDADLLAVAGAGATPEVRSDADMASWIANLPGPEKDAVLLALIRGDDVHARAGLLRRFRGETPTPEGCRTAGALRDAADARRVERERVEEQRRQQAAAEREQRQAAAREQRLAAVAAEGDRAWGRVSSLIATKKPAEYDRAVALLDDLQAVAAADDFGRRLGELRHTHRNKPSLIERLDRARLR